MTPTMVWSAMLPVLLHVLLASHGASSLDAAALHAGALALPWRDELCCDSPSAHLAAEAETNRSEYNLPHRPRCRTRNSATGSTASGGSCVSIRCRIDDDWENLTCDLQRGGGRSGDPDTAEREPMALSMQRLIGAAERSAEPSNPVVCESEDSFTCSMALAAPAGFVAVVTVSVADAVAAPVLLSVPARPVKPDPPVDLSHVQTIQAELILRWRDPETPDAGRLTYEVRYSCNSSHPSWQVVSAPAEPRLVLDLKPQLNYSVQVRRSGAGRPPLWSDWSEPHHIYLDTVSYIPEKVVARPGENVTVYCVFNDHSANASEAVWMLNFREPLQRSQYHAVNEWVSRITVRPSDTRMYDLLRCTKEWTIPYSQIYVEGASIDIKCQTNGNIDAMDCTWVNTDWAKLEFRSRWADLPCELMEERERGGEEVGELGQACLTAPRKTCTIEPLRMNCYKLWLEVPSRLGPIRSRPVYLTPIDHVKPNPPTNVRAVSRSSGVLRVTWEPPSLPVEGLQCQLRVHSSVRAQPEWKIYRPVRAQRAELPVPDMCRVYVVQVSCMHTNGIGYWSDWSDWAYSSPQNSRAPERGPDFWRILQDGPNGNQTNVTLLFQHLPVSGRSYCVDGFIVRRQAAGGTVTRERVDVAASHSFAWSHDTQTVTVEAFNGMGSSRDNVNMVLERQPKRHSVRSFRALLINSTCVSLLWTLADNSSLPLSMVVQWWSPRRQDPSQPPGDQRADTWARLPYTDRAVYLRGDFFGSEEFGFHLYPVFADGEGEPAFTVATRGDPAAYIMLMIISFLSIVLFVTLLLSQNQMKKFMWKDVPNPNKCSWAKGLDFRKAENLDHLFQPPDGLPAWPLLLPSEHISTVVIVDKTEQSCFSVVTPDPADTRGEALPDAAATLPASDAGASTSPYARPDDPRLTGEPPGSGGSSARSSVTYATVLLAEPKRGGPCIDLHFKDGSGSSSSDEGNFSANNSDISGSLPGGLWELESCRGGEADDPRRSCSYNSVEELSEEEEEEEEEAPKRRKEQKELFYLGLHYPAEDDDSEGEEEREEEATVELLKSAVLKREACPAEETHPLLATVDSSAPAPPSSAGSVSYLPQFRTAPRPSKPSD